MDASLAWVTALLPGAPRLDPVAAALPRRPGLDAVAAPLGLYAAAGPQGPSTYQVSRP